MIAGPMAGIATGLGGVFTGGGLQAISDLRAASLIAKAQGMDKLAAKIDTQVADIIKDGPKILDFLDDIFASGKQKANAWAKKNGHDNIEVATKAGVTPKPPVVAAPAPNNDDNDDPFKDVKAQVAATKAKGEELKKTNELLPVLQPRPRPLKQQKQKWQNLLKQQGQQKAVLEVHTV